MSAPNLHRLEGGCYCGNIRVALDWPGAGPTVPVRACGCGFCTKHGAAWTSHPGGWFHLRIADDARATRFRLGTETADFHACAACGVVPVATCMMGGARYAVINAHALDDLKGLQPMQTAMDFEGETTEARLARRLRHWTPEAHGGT